MATSIGSSVAAPVSPVALPGSGPKTHEYVLGISAFYHDSAAALLRDGVVVAAVQEERFTRTKGDASFPANAVAYCLRAAAITIDDVDLVGFYDKPLIYTIF